MFVTGISVYTDWKDEWQPASNKYDCFQLLSRDWEMGDKCHFKAGWSRKFGMDLKWCSSEGILPLPPFPCTSPGHCPQDITKSQDTQMGSTQNYNSVQSSVGTEGAQGQNQGRPKYNKPTKKIYIFPLDTDLGCWFSWNLDLLRNPIEFIELWEIVRDFPSKYLQRRIWFLSKFKKKKSAEKYQHHRKCFNVSFEVDRYKPYSEACGRE